MILKNNPLIGPVEPVIRGASLRRDMGAGKEDSVQMYRVYVKDEGTYPLAAKDLASAIKEAEDYIRDTDYGAVDSAFRVDYAIDVYDGAEWGEVHEGTVTIYPRTFRG